MKPYEKKHTLRNVIIIAIIFFIIAARLSCSYSILNFSSFGNFIKSLEDFFGDLFHQPFNFAGFSFWKMLISFVILSFIVLLTQSGGLTKKWAFEGWMKQKAQNEKNVIVSSNPSQDKRAAANIDEMIGLGNIKEEIDKIIAYYNVQRQRKLKGLEYSPLNINLVFYGNPGTGKTVVARYLAATLRKHHIIKGGQIVEADRATMVSPYTGGTAKLVHDVVEAALGGVLFIDEAYTLTASRDQAGLEAVDTLLKLMEDYKEDLVVIVAGYPDLMRDFINSNPGLQSRFTKHLDFPDYNAQELTQILNLVAKKRDYIIDEEAQAKILDLFEGVVANKGENFANGRLARNIFEQIAEIQATRIGMRTGLLTSRREMMEITAEDIDAYVKSLVGEQ